MKTKVNLLSALLFLLIGTVYTHGNVEGSVAVSYDKETFERGLVQGRNFIMFYAPW